MAGRYKSYPEYKPSGVEWLGDIPADWEIGRLKNFAKIKNGQDYKSVEAEEGFPVFGSGGPFTFSSAYMYDKPSVLLGRKGTIDKPLYVDHAFWTVDTMYYTEMAGNVPAKFLYYLATTIQFGRYSTNTALPSMTQEHLANYYFCAPESTTEQTQIAAFLDHETAKIDALIAKQQRLIALLEEKRQAVISHAVTKGLNPDAPLRPSGIDWLGDVPAHWEVSRIGFFANKIGSGKTPRGGSDVYKKRGVLFLRSQNIYNDGLRTGDGETVFIDSATHKEMDGTKVLNGDILLNITGGSIGRTCIVPSEFPEANVNQHVCIIRCEADVREYLSVFLKSDAISTQVNLFQTGGNREGLNFEQVSKLIVCVPPESERDTILGKLKSLNSTHDKLLRKSQSAIALLKERRTALISAAVTGKIDVRGWQPPKSNSAQNAETSEDVFA